LRVNRKSIIFSCSFSVYIERESGFALNIKLFKERLIKTILFLCAASSIGVIFFIVFSVVQQGYSQIVDWFAHGFGMQWIPDPNLGPYGITPLIFSTLYVGFGGALVATAIGLPCAIYLAEFANKRVRNVVKPALEMLTGFPSVVMGVVGLTVVCFTISRYLTPTTKGYGALAAWIVLGVMSLPTIASVSEDALKSVPQELKEASLALGATKWQTTLRVLLPVAASGIVAAFLLVLGNATGETMAVILVIGNQYPTPITLNPLVPNNVLTALIAQRSQGDAGNVTPEYHAVFAAAFVLFLITAAMNLAVRAVLARRGKNRPYVDLLRRP
jgi:phosphate ABC transporter permease protein PstC